MFILGREIMLLLIDNLRKKRITQTDINFDSARVICNLHPCCKFALLLV